MIAVADHHEPDAMRARLFNRTLHAPPGKDLPNAAFAVDVSDTVHVMHQGTIVHSSSAAALWGDEEIKSQYLGVPGGTAG